MSVKQNFLDLASEYPLAAVLLLGSIQWLSDKIINLTDNTDVVSSVPSWISDYLGFLSLSP